MGTPGGDSRVFKNSLKVHMSPLDFHFDLVTGDGPMRKVTPWSKASRARVLPTMNLRSMVLETG